MTSTETRSPGGTPAKNTPANNGAGTVNGCYSSGAFCLGGDLSGNVSNGTSVQSAIKRADEYGRIGYDLNDNNEIYATINVSRVQSMNVPNPGATKTGITIQCGTTNPLANPIVPASLQQQCTAVGVNSFQFDLSNGELPKDITVYPTRRQ